MRHSRTKTSVCAVGRSVLDFALALCVASWPTVAAVAQSADQASPQTNPVPATPLTPQGVQPQNARPPGGKPTSGPQAVLDYIALNNEDMLGYHPRDLTRCLQRAAEHPRPAIVGLRSAGQADQHHRRGHRLSAGALLIRYAESPESSEGRDA